jgi:hypothetical protein
MCFIIVAIEHLEEREVSKKIAILAKERTCWSTTAPDHLRQGARSVWRNER